MIAKPKAESLRRQLIDAERPLALPDQPYPQEQAGAGLVPDQDVELELDQPQSGHEGGIDEPESDYGESVFASISSPSIHGGGNGDDVGSPPPAPSPAPSPPAPATPSEPPSPPQPVPSPPPAPSPPPSPPPVAPPTPVSLPVPPAPPTPPAPTPPAPGSPIPPDPSGTTEDWFGFKLHWRPPNASRPLGAWQGTFKDLSKDTGSMCRRTTNLTTDLDSELALRCVKTWLIHSAFHDRQHKHKRERFSVWEALPSPLLDERAHALPPPPEPLLNDVELDAQDAQASAAAAVPKRKSRAKTKAQARASAKAKAKAIASGNGPSNDASGSDGASSGSSSN